MNTNDDAHCSMKSDELINNIFLLDDVNPSNKHIFKSKQSSRTYYTKQERGRHENASEPIDIPIPISKSLPTNSLLLNVKNKYNSLDEKNNITPQCLLCFDPNCKTSYHNDITRYCKTCKEFIGSAKSLYCLECEKYT